VIQWKTPNVAHQASILTMVTEDEATFIYKYLKAQLNDVVITQMGE
jgi:hypothetical protein